MKPPAPAPAGEWTTDRLDREHEKFSTGLDNVEPHAMDSNDYYFYLEPIMTPIAQLRMTRQRELILQELKRTRSHPSADELYEVLRRRLPRISLGTVYRNLELLSERGLARKLPGPPMRFDAETRSHQHARCLDCGRIQDLDLEGPLLPGAAVQLPGWEIRESALEVLGRCPSCRARARPSRGKPGNRRRPGKSKG